jgi:hypothetical protein
MFIHAPQTTIHRMGACQLEGDSLTHPVDPFALSIFVVNYTMNMMDSLSSPLAESYTAFPSSPSSPTGTDTEFPIEVDLSFNSSMSISDEGMSLASPTPASQASRPTAKFSPVQSRSNVSTDGFLSPIPTANLFKPKPTRPTLSPIQQMRAPLHTAPAVPTTKRAFGSEWSSNAPRPQAMFVSKSKGMMGPPVLPEGKGFKARPALPSDWAMAKDMEIKPRMMAPTMMRREVSVYAARDPCLN